MEDTITEKLLRTVKSKIQTHNEFKKEYDRQLAFDFNYLNFFSIGENKISEVLSFFLNPRENHGQSDVFLHEFVKMFIHEDIDISKPHIACEHCIDNQRRLDIFIRFKNKVVAIENKVWAIDQLNQIKDYSTYLDNISNGNYLLFYLTPDGVDPSVTSIENDMLLKLKNDKKFHILSYKNDIINLLDKWIQVCQAEKVTHFLKQFRIYLQTTTLSKLEIYFDNITIEKIGPFNWEGYRVYKYGISKANNKIWIQVVKEKIDLNLGSYFENKTDYTFQELVNKEDIEKYILDRDISKDQIVHLFIERVKNVAKILSEYNPTE